MLIFAREKVPEVNSDIKVKYSRNSDECNDDIVISQYRVSNNRVHKSTQPPPSSFQEISLRRKIMSVHYVIRPEFKDVPASLFGGIRGICRNGYRLIRASYNLSSTSPSGTEPSEIRISSYNLSSTSGTSKQYN